MTSRLLTFLLAAASLAAQNASIAGVVVDGVSGKPLPGVALLLAGPSPLQQQNSDERGRFQFAKLQPGLYQLSAHGTFSDVLGTRSIALDTGQEITGVELRVLPSGSIAGRLLDENRKPVIGLRVELMGSVYQSGRLKYQLQGFAAPDANGAYILRGVRPRAEYFVVARPPSGRLDPVSKESADPAERSPAPAAAWFGDAADVTSAAPIVLFPGENRENVDLRIRRLPPRCIEAALLAPGGPAPLEFEVLDAAGIRLYGSRAAADGALRVCRPERTELHIVAYRQPAGADAALLATATVPAGDRDVKGLRIGAAPAYTLSGRVDWDGDAPAAPVSGTLSVVLSPANRPPHPFESISMTKTPLPGAFSLQALGEDQILSLGLPGVPKGVYIKQAMFGGAKVEASRVRLDSAGNGAGLQVTVARDGGALTVQVQDQEGKPAPDTWVIVTPYDSPSEGAMSSAMEAGITNHFGVAAFPTFKPGRYLAIGTDHWLDLNHATISRIWRARTKAKELTVAPNASIQITLTRISIDW